MFNKSVYEILIWLAFRALIDCDGIWMLSVNARFHAECLTNGCPRMAASASVTSAPHPIPSLPSSPPLPSSTREKVIYVPPGGVGRDEWIDAFEISGLIQ